jgi:hypothetical protein
LNYKVVDLDKIYNFHIKFIFIRVYPKNCDFSKRSYLYRCLKQRLELLQYSRGVTVATAVVNGGWGTIALQPPFTTTLLNDAWKLLLKFFGSDIYFSNIMKNVKIKIIQRGQACKILDSCKHSSPLNRYDQTLVSPLPHLPPLPACGAMLPP